MPTVSQIIRFLPHPPQFYLSVFPKQSCIQKCSDTTNKHNRSDKLFFLPLFAVSDHRLDAKTSITGSMWYWRVKKKTKNVRILSQVLKLNRVFLFLSPLNGCIYMKTPNHTKPVIYIFIILCHKTVRLCFVVLVCSVVKRTHGGAGVVLLKLQPLIWSFCLSL